MINNGWEDCTDGFLGFNELAESCNTQDDYYANGKKWDGFQDAGCICKKGLCKISCKKNKI